MRVGDFTLAIGDPLGLGQTVTMGIISAKGRGNVGIVDYEDFLQTDAAINPGNSGGALVNVDGQVIGVPTAIATIGGARGNQGIGFAVPSNLAREVMTQIEQHGRVIRGWLGVAVQDVTPAMEERARRPGAGGARRRRDPGEPGRRGGAPARRRDQADRRQARVGQPRAAHADRRDQPGHDGAARRGAQRRHDGGARNAGRGAERGAAEAGGRRAGAHRRDRRRRWRR